MTALILVNHQAPSDRLFTVRGSQAIAQLLAFVGVVAGFWHIMWLAGVGILVSSFAAMMVHSAGYFRLERAAKAAASAEHATPQPPKTSTSSAVMGVHGNRA